MTRLGKRADVRSSADSDGNRMESGTCPRYWVRMLAVSSRV